MLHNLEGGFVNTAAHSQRPLNPAGIRCLKNWTCRTIFNYPELTWQFTIHRDYFPFSNHKAFYFLHQGSRRVCGFGIWIKRRGCWFVGRRRKGSKAQGTMENCKSLTGYVVKANNYWNNCWKNANSRGDKKPKISSGVASHLSQRPPSDTEFEIPVGKCIFLLFAMPWVYTLLLNKDFFWLSFICWKGCFSTKHFIHA